MSCSRPASWSRPTPNAIRTSSGRIRGGGGNFGIVTSFLFRLHPVVDVVGGPVFWGLDQAADVLRWYRDFIREAPPELNGLFAFVTVPPVPVVPRAPPRPQDGRDHLVLMRAAGGRRGGVRPDQGVRAAGPLRRPADAAARSPGDVRSAVSRRICCGSGGPTSSRRSRTRRSMSTFDSVPALPTGHSTMHLYPIDWSRPRGRPYRHRVQLPRCELGDGHRRRRPGPGERGRSARLDDGVLEGDPPLFGRRRPT